TIRIVQVVKTPSEWSRGDLQSTRCSSTRHEGLPQPQKQRRVVRPAGKIAAPMPRSPLFAQLSRSFRIARWCDEHGASAQEGVEQARALERRTLSSRREFL